MTPNPNFQIEGTGSPNFSKNQKKAQKRPKTSEFWGVTHIPKNVSRQGRCFLNMHQTRIRPVWACFGHFSDFQTSENGQNWPKTGQKEP